MNKNVSVEKKRKKLAIFFGVLGFGEEGSWGMLHSLNPPAAREEQHEEWVFTFHCVEILGW